MDATRERLIAAAVRLFQSRGYAGAGLTEILTAAGCAKGTLYHHFPSGKAALAVAAVDVIGSEVERFLTARFDAGHGAADTLLALAELTGRWLERTHFTQGGLLSALAASDLGSAPDLAARIAATQDRWLVSLSDRLPLPQSALEARCALATLDGAIAMARVQRDGLLVRRLMEPVARRWAEAAELQS